MRRPTGNLIERLAHAVYRRQLPLETETSIFVLMNVLDFITTWYMLTHGNTGGNFFESNPIARFFLDHWGVRGLLIFKMGVVAFVCVIAQIVATRRESSARFLLVMGTLAVTVVVIYSWRLYWTTA